jgi:hypothetical protein
MAAKELIKIANYLISTYSLSKFAWDDDEEGLAWQDNDPWDARVPAAATSEDSEDEEPEEAWDESWEESDEEDDEPGDYGNWPVIPSAKSEEPNTDLEEEFRREQFMKNFLDADMRKIRTKKDYKGEYKPWQH